MNVEDAVVARLDRSGEHFELLVDCDKAMQYKKGELKDLSQVLAVQQVFKNASTGDKHSEQALKKAFNTTSVGEVADKILKKGEIQLTAEYRKKRIKEKKQRILDYITRNAVDPRTKNRIPKKRVELAMQEAKTSVDPHETAQEQVDRVVDELRPVLPISFEKKKYEVTVPAKHAPKTHSRIMQFGKPDEQKWLSNGSFYCKISLPAGKTEEFINTLNKLTNGEITIKEKK